MINLLLSLAAAALVYCAFFFTHLLGAGAVSSIVPALIAFGVSYALLARRTGQQLQAVMDGAQKQLVARKPDLAVAALRSAFPLGRWQIGVTSSLHANIGQLLYVQKKFDEAEPHLRAGAALKLGPWIPRGMLAALYFRRKQFDEMAKTFESALTGNKKEPLLYATWAWCEHARGEKKKALEILQRGAHENPADEKLKNLLQKAQNDKRLKMDVFGEQWWQFLLEVPAQMTPGGAGGMPFSGRQRFGRGGYRR